MTPFVAFSEHKQPHSAQAVPAVGTARKGNDEEDEAPKEHQLQKLKDIAVDIPVEDVFVENPGKKLGQARMLRKTALARTRQIGLRRMKLGKKHREKMQRRMRGPRARAGSGGDCGEGRPAVYAA